MQLVQFGILLCFVSHNFIIGIVECFDVFQKKKNLSDGLAAKLEREMMPKVTNSQSEIGVN